EVLARSRSKTTWKSHLTTSRIRTSRAPAHIQLPHAFYCIFCNFHARGRWNFLPRRGACGRPSPGIRMVIISEEAKTQVQYPYLPYLPCVVVKLRTRRPARRLHCSAPYLRACLPYLTLPLRTFQYNTTAPLRTIITGAASFSQIDLPTVKNTRTALSAHEWLRTFLAASTVVCSVTLRGISISGLAADTHTSFLLQLHPTGEAAHASYLA
ncbi:hypothetical protein CPAR01_02834, partial [Colletotrichum paranaense]